MCVLAIKGGQKSALKAKRCVSFYGCPIERFAKTHRILIFTV
jgi:hypothetical protein